MASPRAAPRTCRAYYKVVAAIPARTGQPRLLSIFDGVTSYTLGMVTSPTGGVWVCPDVLTCVRHADQLPNAAALGTAPRAIIKALCWGTPPASAHPPSASKQCFAHCLPVALLPYTAALQPNTPVGVDLTGDTVCTLDDPRPNSAPTPRPPALRLNAGTAARMFGSDGGTRLQAMTATLHEDVLYAEAQLERLRAISRQARIRSQEPGVDTQRPAWIRRALARA